MLGCLRRAGFSIPLTGHAYSVLDSYVYGFVHTELTLPFRRSEQASEVAGQIFERLPAGAFPHLVEFATQHVLVPGYSYPDEFPYGLELILDGRALVVRGGGGSVPNTWTLTDALLLPRSTGPARRGAAR